MLILLLAIMTAAPDAGIPPPPDTSTEAASLRRRATKEYQARRYATACPLFAQAFTLLPRDGGLATDLGLCLLRQGKKPEARRVLEDAILLAKDDGRTRRAAAFNLALLGEELAPRQGCSAVAPARGCEKPVHVCTADYAVAGPQEVMSGRVAVIQSDPVTAPATVRELAREMEECANRDDPFGCAFNLLSERSVLELSADGDNSRSGQTPPLRSCRLVYANACTGVAFAACADPSGGKPKEVILERHVRGAALP